MSKISVPFFPSFFSVKKNLTFKPEQGGAHVDITYDAFLEIMKLFARTVKVDESWYLSKYADVKEAISQGNIRSAKEHWIEFGYFEGRLPYELEVDSDWYLEKYPDIAEAVKSSVEISALSHYQRIGYMEGRLPCEW